MTSLESYVPRLLDLPSSLSKKSCFLFGPRQTGKSSLIRHTLPDAKTYNLLDNQVLLDLSRSPQALAQELKAGEVVVIDEIQKLPSLLDMVHLLIEEKGIRFLLTGSSARKLRRGGVNLLGGRARSFHLHPFCYAELKARFDIEKAIHHGLLPSLYFSDQPDLDLKAYAADYLKEEIAQEGFTRNIPSFSRFLEVAALCNGQLINYTNIANDAQVPRTTVQEYFQILKDTLIAYELPSWGQSKKRKAISTSKFYFFDTGIVRWLQHRQKIHPRSPEFGELFETYLHHELKSFLDYRQMEGLSYWRSTSGYEVHFLVGDSLALEAKGGNILREDHLKGLRALREEKKKFKHYVLVNFQARPAEIDGIEILPWKLFLEKLWAGEFC